MVDANIPDIVLEPDKTVKKVCIKLYIGCHYFPCFIIEGKLNQNQQLTLICRLSELK